MRQCASNTTMCRCRRNVQYTAAPPPAAAAAARLHLSVGARGGNVAAFCKSSAHKPEVCRRTRNDSTSVAVWPQSTNCTMQSAYQHMCATGFEMVPPEQTRCLDDAALNTLPPKKSFALLHQACVPASSHCVVRQVVTAFTASHLPTPYIGTDCLPGRTPGLAAACTPRRSLRHTQGADHRRPVRRVLAVYHGRVHIVSCLHLCPMPRSCAFAFSRTQKNCLAARRAAADLHLGGPSTR